MFGLNIRNDKRGMSLIELICALAILGIITTTVGGAMAVATNSYRRGTVETSLQQEAQFTTNNIESLIIDATKEVHWRTNASSQQELVIINEDKSYGIAYDAANGKLLYSEYNATELADVVDGNKIADVSDQLLADHVSGFTADPSNFAVARTVLLALTLENGSSSYTSSYNVTSRNNVNAGDAPDESASFNLETVIVLEPGQTYVLPVQIIGTSTDYTATLEPDTDNDSELTITSNGKGDKNPNDVNTKVTKQSDGVKIEIGVNETGGTDQIRKVSLATTKQNASGDALARAEVTVLIRRVREIKITSSLISGVGAKTGAVYELTVTDANFNHARATAGTYMDKVAGTNSDALDYINPRTVHWEVHNDATGKVKFLSGQDSNTVRIQLESDIDTTTNIVKAVAQHPNGNNKTTVAYDGTNVYDIFKITVTEAGDSGILRGKQAYLYPNGNMSVQQWVEQQLGAETDGPKKLITYVRLVSKDGVNKSDGYDSGKWFKVGDGGGLIGSAMYFNFRADDFTSLVPTYYSKDYTLEVAYAVLYKDKNENHYSWYPNSTIPGLNDQWYGEPNAPDTITGYNPSAADFGDTTKPYLLKYQLGATTAEFMGVATSAVYTDSGISIPSSGMDREALENAGYLSARGAGLGYSNPLTINKSNPEKFIGRINGATTEKVRGMLETKAYIKNERTGEQYHLKDVGLSIDFQYSSDPTSKKNYFEIGFESFFGKTFYQNSLDTDTFRITFDEFSGYNDGTNGGIEHYNQYVDSDLVTDGRGIIRFKIN